MTDKDFTWGGHDLEVKPDKKIRELPYWTNADGEKTPISTSSVIGGVSTTDLVTISTATLRRWYESLDGYHESDVPDTVKTRDEMEIILMALGDIKEHNHD